MGLPKIMKRAVYLLTAAVCCMLFPLPVAADMIMEPMDSFYEEHASECSYVGRAFTASGPDGKVILYKSPKLPEVVDTWENGREVFIQFAYEDEDGVAWGIFDDFNGTVGWMPMDYMELVYDSLSFQEEHEAQITDRKGTLDQAYLEKDIFFWQYPGSEECSVLRPSPNLPDYCGIYVDESARSWGLVGYYYGYRDMWICLDAPDADFSQLYPGGSPNAKVRESGDAAGQAVGSQAPSPEDSKEAAEDSRIVPKPDHRMTILAIALVAAVAAGTAVLLVVLWKKPASKKSP